MTRSVFARVERAAASVARLARTVSHHSHRSRVHVEVAVRVRDAPEGAPRRALKRRAPREAGNRAAHTAPPRAATWGSRESEGGDDADARRRESAFDFCMVVDERCFELTREGVLYVYVYEYVWVSIYWYL